MGAETRKELSLRLHDLEVLAYIGAIRSPKELREGLVKLHKEHKQRISEMCGVEVGSPEYRQRCQIDWEFRRRTEGARIVIILDDEELKSFIESLNYVLHAHSRLISGPPIESLREKLMLASKNLSQSIDHRSS